MIAAVVSLVAAYLLGSLPTGFLVARSRGIDIRRQGSGSTGATNVGRTLGAPVAAGVMVIDVAKGAAAVALANLLSGEPGLAAAAGLAAMVGHAFPVWTGFRGGKAVATGLGATLGLIPPAAPAVIVTWVIVVLATRYVSVASIAAAAGLPVAALLLGRPAEELLFAVLAALLVIGLHHANIGRLMRGEERRLRPFGTRAAG